MNSFVEWLQQLQFGGIFSTVLVVAASLICITFHETCHGLVAYWLGDTTAKDAGRLTLNPIKHVDIVGLVMMAILKFGWAKPVPVDMRNFKKPKRDMALTALAGPLSNVLLAIVALLIRSCVLFFVLRSPENAALGYLLEFIEYVAVISAGLAVFNLIPISPLDGSKVLFALLPTRGYMTLLRYERYGMLALIALMFFGILDGPLIFLRGEMLDALVKITSFPFYWMVKLFA